MAVKKKFRLTRGGWVLLLVGCLMTVGAFNAGLNLTYLLASLLLGLFLVAVVMPFTSLRGLVCRRALAAAPHAGEEFGVELQLCSLRRTTTRMVAVTDPLGKLGRKLALSVPPGACLRLHCRLEPLPRGVHILPGLRWSSRFPFGVAEVTVHSQAGDELVVYPARGRLGARATGGVRTRETTTGAPALRGWTSDDFRIVREYLPGDSLRHIHWRVSAHRGQLHVREMERERSTPVVIVLDARVPAALTGPRRDEALAALETAISFAGELSRYVLAQDCGVALVGFFPAARTISVRPGPNAIIRIYESLARLQPSAASGPDALLGALRALGPGHARLVAVSPLRETGAALRAMLHGWRAEFHVVEDAGFAAVFTPAQPPGAAAPAEATA